MKEPLPLTSEPVQVKSEPFVWSRSLLHQKQGALSGLVYISGVCIGLTLSYHRKLP